jgi:predicted AlkP superfamily pyrophosphatase or phosphodiesterase
MTSEGDELGCVSPDPVLPAYTGANLRGIVPSLLGPSFTRGLPEWFPEPVRGAKQVVLLLLDGLGWEQFQDFGHLMPNLSTLVGHHITTIAPSTTATALTSLVTGLAPGEHGLVGYRMDVGGEVLNVLRWASAKGDMRKRIPPKEMQPFPPFLGEKVPVISRIELEGSGFTVSHLDGVIARGWRVMSNINVQITRALAEGHKLVYAYYDGVDKTAHEHGFDEFYAAELIAADRLVGDIIASLPPDVALLVTADHGQVIVEADKVIPPADDVMACVRMQSGEGRFRWLHAKPGAQRDLLAACEEAHGDVAWVRSREQAIDEGWFGPTVSGPVAKRYGDVALVPFELVSFHDPADSGPYQLVSRHGSLTAAEMLIPLLATRRA